MNVKHILPMALALLVATSSLQMVGMSAIIHPAAISVPVSAAPQQPVQVTVNGQSSNWGSSTIVMGAAILTLGLITLRTKHELRMIRAENRRIRAEVRTVHNTVVTSDTNTQARFNQTDANIENIRGDIETAHQATGNSLRSINENIHDLAHNRALRHETVTIPVSFNTPIRNATVTPLTQLPNLSEQPSIYELVENGVARAFTLTGSALYSAPGIVISAVTKVGNFMNSPAQPSTNNVEVHPLFGDY